LHCEARIKKAGGSENDHMLKIARKKTTLGGPKFELPPSNFNQTEIFITIVILIVVVSMVFAEDAPGPHTCGEGGRPAWTAKAAAASLSFGAADRRNAAASGPDTRRPTGGQFQMV